jgi:hypothetical protein
MQNRLDLPAAASETSASSKPQPTKAQSKKKKKGDKTGTSSLSVAPFVLAAVAGAVTASLIVLGASLLFSNRRSKSQ